MKDPWKTLPLAPTAPVAEILLAETAIRIELPPSLHQLAVDRYEAVRKHIERLDSPLHNRVRIFYPQGSMAIRATIKSGRRADGFDIDIVAELILSPTMAPREVLDLLFEAINGPRGSLYHGMVERQTRCVTVYYADGMHLDITPSMLLDEFDPRKSVIFHAKPEEPPSAHRRLLMNSFAFCDWFNGRAPIDIDFATAYAKRVKAWDRPVTRADADVKPVPTHSTIEGGKSTTVVALQLLKRNRNMCYASRKGFRMPPSVMMAKFAGETLVSRTSIASALDAISAAILSELERVEAAGVLIDIRNPKCDEDRFTDRWPENREAQRIYLEDLKLFRKQLASLTSDQLTLDQKRDLLARMFGEAPAQSAVEEYAAMIGQSIKSGKRSVAPSGRILPAVAAPIIVSSRAAQPRHHTFFGTSWKR